MIKNGLEKEKRMNSYDNDGEGDRYDWRLIAWAIFVVIMCLLQIKW